MVLSSQTGRALGGTAAKIIFFSPGTGLYQTFKMQVWEVLLTTSRYFIGVGKNSLLLAISMMTILVLFFFYSHLHPLWNKVDGCRKEILKYSEILFNSFLFQYIIILKINNHVLLSISPLHYSF